MKIYLYNSDLVAQVDPVDFEVVASLPWGIYTENGKPCARKNGASGKSLARTILQRMLPQYTSTNYRFRFINGDTLDCRRTNLAPASRSIDNTLTDTDNLAELARYKASCGG